MRKAGDGIEGQTITSAAAKARSKSSHRSCRAREREAVVRLVVAGGQGEGAEQDPPLDLGAESRGPGLQIERARGPSPTRAGRSARRRNGRGWRRLPRSRSRSRSRWRRWRGERRRRRCSRPRRGRSGGPSRGPPRPRDRGRRPRPRRGSRRAGRPTPRPSAASGVADGRVGRRRVERIEAGDDPVEPGGVGDAPRERADLIERGGKRDEPVAGHAPVRRLEADDAATGRRLPDRASGVRAEAGRDEAGRHRRGASPRGAARDPGGIPGVSRHVEELFSVDEPMANSSMLARPMKTAPALPQPGRDRGVPRRTEALQDARRAGRAPAGDPDVVLHRERHSGQGELFAGRDPAVDVPGLAQRFLAGDLEKGPHAPVARARSRPGPRARRPRRSGGGRKPPPPSR